MVAAGWVTSESARGLLSPLNDCCRKARCEFQVSSMPAAELQAFDAGEIDAVMDRDGGCAHLLPEAQDALIELIAEKTDRGEPLGAVLGAYNIRLLHPGIPRQRGKSKVSNMLQDISIAALVFQLVEWFPPLKPTRFKTWQPSACSIVAEVLPEFGLHRGGEKAVQAIWRHYGPAVSRWP